MRARDRSRLRAILIVVAVVCAIAVVVALPFFSVRMTVTQSLVGPEEPAIALLFRGASLPDIQAAVRASGKSPDRMQFFDATFLYLAVEKNRPDVVAWLLEAGANPNGGGPRRLPLSAAIDNRDGNMVRLLVEWGADPNMKTGGLGRTLREKANLPSNDEVTRALDSIPRSTAATRPATSEMP